jgi:hypothetical protein
VTPRLLRRDKIREEARKCAWRRAYREVAKILGKTEQLNLYSFKAQSCSNFSLLLI